MAKKKREVMQQMIIEDDGKKHFNLERLRALLDGNIIASLITDDGTTVLAEIWKQDNQVLIYPFAKLLTEEEKDKLKLNGEVLPK